jgi:hypothetical protein
VVLQVTGHLGGETILVFRKINRRTFRGGKQVSEKADATSGLLPKQKYSLFERFSESLKISQEY